MRLFKFFFKIARLTTNSRLSMNFGNLVSTTCLDIMKNLMRGIVDSGI